jgi:hypothetical protein
VSSVDQSSEIDTAVKDAISLFARRAAGGRFDSAHGRALLMISGTRMLFFFEELPPPATFPPTLRGLARRQSTNDDHARYPPSHTLQQPRPEYQYTVAVNLLSLIKFPACRGRVAARDHREGIRSAEGGGDRVVGLRS